MKPKEGAIAFLVLLQLFGNETNGFVLPRPNFVRATLAGLPSYLKDAPTLAARSKPSSLSSSSSHNHHHAEKNKNNKLQAKPLHMSSSSTLDETLAPSSSSQEEKLEGIVPWERHLQKLREGLAEKTSSSRFSSPALPLNKRGLSKIHRSIVDNTCGPQRFVTGREPLFITAKESPTKRWLRRDAATTQIYVNGTAAAASLASFERFQWLDDHEIDTLLDQYSMVSLELVGEIRTKKPGYVTILPSQGAGSTAAVRRAAESNKDVSRWKKSLLYQSHVLEEEKNQYYYNNETRAADRLWITGFSLASSHGHLSSLDISNGHLQRCMDETTSKSIPWPNECASVPQPLYPTTKTAASSSSSAPGHQDAILVSDGFLVPGKDKGGLYIIKNPGNQEQDQQDDQEEAICLTGGAQSIDAANSGWFYHKAVWVDLAGDGRKSILTARAKLSSSSSTNQNAKTQLVWLETPQPHSVDKTTGVALEQDGITPFDPFHARHLPWKTHVLQEGPDVMFAVADMDTQDNTIEVIASRFFDKKVSIHSIQQGPNPRIVFERTIDENCGAAFASILATLDPKDAANNNGHRSIIDSGSTVTTDKPGDSFSHLLVTSHECKNNNNNGYQHKKTSSSRKNSSSSAENRGGSLFAYRIPSGKDAWKTEKWTKTVVASGFSVRDKLGNIINPGAPGFCYTFYAKRSDAITKEKRPLIAVAGDCSESAYLFRPVDDQPSTIRRRYDTDAHYKLMCEIECGGTVGSIGVGYEDFMHAPQEHDFAKLYIPCYEKDKILVFAMGTGKGQYDDEW